MDTLFEPSISCRKILGSEMCTIRKALRILWFIPAEEQDRDYLITYYTVTMMLMVKEGLIHEFKAMGSELSELMSS